MKSLVKVSRLIKALNLSLFILLAILISGCSTISDNPFKKGEGWQKRWQRREEIEQKKKDFNKPWRNVSEYHIPRYAKYLAGTKICLDPGHGGDAHIPGFKKSPSGFREATMNWRVAIYLREFLEKSGAEVIMTRDGDQDISLSARCAIANSNNVDVFLSIHHNYASRKTATFTSTWYHADADYMHCNLDIARCVQEDLSNAMNTPEIIRYGLFSDYQMYKTGFGVLRELKVPGCLVECSFYSNYEEEQNLKEKSYNKLEAYGLLLGLARYFSLGRPYAEMISDSEIIPGEPMQVVLQLYDGIGGKWRIIPGTIKAELDGQLVNHEFNSKETRVSIPLSVENMDVGDHEVVLNYMNVNKNSAIPQKFGIKVGDSREKSNNK